MSEEAPRALMLLLVLDGDGDIYLVVRVEAEEWLGVDELVVKEEEWWLWFG